MEKGDNRSVEFEGSKLGKDFRATIPKPIRILLGINPEDDLIWVYDKDVDGAWVKKKEG